MSAIKKISSIKTITVPLEIEERIDMFQTSDGRKFESEKEADKHQEKIEADAIERKKKADEKKEAEKYITPIEFGDSGSDIASLVLSGYDVSSSQFFKWTATKDEKIIKIVATYLASVHCQINIDELKKFGEEHEGKRILIGSWAEGENGDYPTYPTKGITVMDALKIIDGISSKLKNC